MYVYIRGQLDCVRCRKTSDAWIQTHLLHTDSGNCGRDYHVGDSEVMDGLDDYCSIHPWDGSSPLVIAVGDWECEHCHLNWQWARAVFTVHQGVPHPSVTLRELSTLQPWQPSDLGGVHFVEPDLAELSGLWARHPDYHWLEGVQRWNACQVPERCERVAAGFREWCRDVAEVQPRRGDRE